MEEFNDLFELYFHKKLSIARSVARKETFLCLFGKEKHRRYAECGGALHNKVSVREQEG